MAFLDLFRRKEPTDRDFAERLAEFVMTSLTDRDNRIRAEDTICAAAAVVGERCIDAAGDYPLRDHQIAPGTRVFSVRANELLAGDSVEGGLDAVPAASVFGILKAGLNSHAYAKDQFPDLGSVFQGFAAGIGKSEDWGRVPVTVASGYHPGIIPLQFAFETRDRVDSILKPVASELRRMHIATEALATLLNKMAGAIPPDVALRLAFEITNGMAKTAPMTKRAWLAAQSGHSK